MKLEDITKKYYLKKHEITILEKVSYNFLKGKFYVINGASGSGKTTLVNILGLMLNYNDGTYYIDKQNVNSLRKNELAKIRNKKIGFIFQDYNLDENLKAYENVMLPLLLNKSLNNKERKDIAITILKKLGLEDRINHYPKELSGGECQRVAIARSLVNNPDYIIADEPTGNLDAKNEDKIFKILKDLSTDGKCVIVVSHSLHSKKYADIILKIEDKKLMVV